VVTHFLRSSKIGNYLPLAVSLFEAPRRLEADDEGALLAASCAVSLSKSLLEDDRSERVLLLRPAVNGRRL